MTLAPERVIADDARPSVPAAVAESRDGPRAKKLSAITIERVDARALLRHQAAWSDLLARVLEPNVFLDPAFALPLFQHLRFDARPDVLLAWEADGPGSPRRLVGLFPVRMPSPRRWPAPLAWGLRHPQVTLGTPLLDEARGAEAFAAMLDWLETHRSAGVALVLTAIPTDGAFCTVLRAMAERQGRPVACLDAHHRAILRGGADFGESFRVPTILSSKKRKELRRQRRRLGDAGVITYHSAATPSEIRRAAERFLALEHDGWKGRRGTALLADPTLATFTRTMTRLMAHDGRCRIDSLDVDGVPVAMGILVMAGTRAHFWKTTFDERFSHQSPGVQFALDLTAHQALRPGLTLTDSCAVPDHPMIDRIWSDRMAMADVMVALRPSGEAGRDRAFVQAVRLETARRALRRLAKRIGKSGLRRLAALRATPPGASAH